MTGATVGRYEVLDKLGEGGMGIVYRARDVLLNRFVALKFLPADAGLDDERKRRFLQEAQVASALNHPNIVTIYEVSVAPPHEFIAMEYVPGRPLDTVIAPHGLPLAGALSCSVQIADALAAAHAAGIVHRDVKPGNVIVADNGLVKVLDFGLAKLLERGSNAAAGLTQTVAIGSSPRTVEGAVIGTVSYMSPEQAEGKPVDHRSDIFSFGAMLYEMLTGKRAFVGDSPVSTLAAVLRSEPPDIAASLPETPGEVRRILRRCLEKAPERRWQSMSDVRALLDDVRQDLQSGNAARTAVPEPARRTPRYTRWVLGTAAMVVLAAAGIALWRPGDAAGPVPAYTFRRVTSDSASNVSPALSPDGKLLAYSSDRSQSGATDIWVQQIAGGEPVRLTSGLGLCHSPSFSPDGSRIAFHGGPDARGIYVISTFGGSARRVADGRGPAFSPDGTQISYMGSSNDRIMLVPATGGTPREIPVKHGVINRAQWLPDGKRLLFLGADSSGTSYDWYSVSLDGGEEKSCGASKWMGHPFDHAVPQSIASDGVMVYAALTDTANLYRVPFDVTRAAVTGPPEPVTMAPGINFWPSASSDGARIAFGSAPSFNTNLWSLSLDPVSNAVTGEAHRLSEGLVDRAAPYPSSDGKRLVYKATSGTSQDIRLLDLATGRETRIAETSQASPPVMSDDGTQVVYAVREKDGLSMYAVPLAGGIARRLCTGCGRPVEWFAGGARILYDQAANNTEAGVLDVAGGRRTAIVKTEGSRVYTPRLSPDRRVLCFTVLSGARDRRAYLARFADDRPIPRAEWKPLTDDAVPDERQPFWSPDGRTVYFLSERDGFRCVWGVKIDPASLKALDRPFPVYHLHQFRHSLLDFGDVADIGLSVAGRKMFLAAREFSSNIWLAERAAR